MSNSKQTQQIDGFEHIPYTHPCSFTENEMLNNSKDYYHFMNQRRSVRMFSDKPVSKEVIEQLILTASTSPSGAHKQPWTFCAVSNPSLKKEIRLAAEKEEQINYESRMSDRWKEDLKPLATNANKSFLETVPWLLIAFKKVYDLNESGEKQNNYYVNESVGIACGILISAIHHAGLVTLTHTPSPMDFLQKILGRPENERAYILFPVGYAASEATVPNILRKPLKDISSFYE